MNKVGVSASFLPLDLQPETLDGNVELQDGLCSLLFESDLSLSCLTGIARQLISHF